MRFALLASVAWAMVSGLAEPSPAGYSPLVWPHSAVGPDALLRVASGRPISRRVRLGWLIARSDGLLCLRAPVCVRPPSGSPRRLCQRQGDRRGRPV